MVAPLVFASFTTSVSLTAQPAPGPDVKDRIGLQLYSLRDQFAKDVPGTMAEVQKFGIKNVELAGTYGLSVDQFKEQLDAHGLRPISAHYAFEQFRDHIDDVISDAQKLGLQYIGCAWIPHDGPFDEKTCHQAISVFDKAGEALAKHGIKFFYHTHGYEFQPHGDGTLFDQLVTETNPKYVSFEMDVFWIVHAGQDPVKLLEKYGSRWMLLHVKGMRDSTPTGLLTGSSSVTNDVPVSAGKIDFPPLLRAAQKDGVQWYFIEDESPSSEEQIPQSIRYLQNVEL